MKTDFLVQLQSVPCFYNPFDNLESRLNRRRTRMLLTHALIVYRPQTRTHLEIPKLELLVIPSQCLAPTLITFVNTQKSNLLLAGKYHTRHNSRRMHLLIFNCAYNLQKAHLPTSNASIQLERLPPLWVFELCG